MVQKKPAAYKVPHAKAAAAKAAEVCCRVDVLIHFIDDYVISSMGQARKICLIGNISKVCFYE